MILNNKGNEIDVYFLYIIILLICYR